MSVARAVSGLTVVYGVGLKTIKFKEAVFDGDVTNKMEGFHGSHRTDSILFLW